MYKEQIERAHELICITSGTLEDLQHNGFFQTRHDGSVIITGFIIPALDELHEIICDLWEGGEYDERNSID